jgi:hypothetical protein
MTTSISPRMEPAAGSRSDAARALRGRRAVRRAVPSQATHAAGLSHPEHRLVFDRASRRLLHIVMEYVEGRTLKG